MKKFVAIIWGISWRTVAFLIVMGGILFLANNRHVWDARKHYETQDASLKGKVGVAVVALTMPEKYEVMFFENFVGKIFSEVIPWPINVLAGADAGVALVDPTNPRATERFAPKVLADIWGRTTDIDGVAWAEKYRRGEIRFVKPSATIAFDNGFFLYPKRKGGIRTATAKTLLKARYVMYARLPNGYLPHFSQTIGMGEAALTALKERHGIAAGAVVEAFNPAQMESSVRSILDSGVDTLVLASVQPFYSDFEELKGSYPHVHDVVETWRKEHQNKPIKIVIAPYMATATTFDQLWAQELTNVAPSASKPGQSVARVILSFHGLPVSQMKSDSWVPRAKSAAQRLTPVLKAVMQAKGYANVEVIQAAESFADVEEDPKNLIVSVAEEFARAKKDNIELAIALPVEFMAENTDTLFTHANNMFHGQPGYSAYMGPPDGTDWNKPYVRRFQNGATTIMYAGAPGGDAVPRAGQVLADALEPLWK
jgi:protoheme ferro-lyase